jgi:hypothetical protein
MSPDTFDELYAPTIRGAGGREFPRSATRIKACPTDDQGEVLVHRMIPLADVKTVVVPTESDAKRIHAALDQIGADIDDLRWTVAPTLFNAPALSSAIAQGISPTETSWEPE